MPTQLTVSSLICPVHLCVEKAPCLGLRLQEWDCRSPRCRALLFMSSWPRKTLTWVLEAEDETNAFQLGKSSWVGSQENDPHDKSWRQWSGSSLSLLLGKSLAWHATPAALLSVVAKPQMKCGPPLWKQYLLMQTSSCGENEILKISFMLLNHYHNQ